MEKYVNDVMFRLSNKLSPNDIETVRNVIYNVSQNYDITEKVTALAVVDYDLPIEARTYLAIRLVDGLSEKTLQQYKRTLEKFFFSVRKPVREVTTEDCRIFLFRLQESSNMKNRALDDQRTYLKAFFSWLTDNEYINRNPLAPIKPFKYEKKVKKALSEMEIEQLRLACKNEYEKAILEVLYSTACRVSELVNIKLTDIDINNGDILISHGKGNKERISYLNAKAILAIQEYTKNRNWKSEYLFENSKKPHNQLSTRSIEKVTKRLEKKTGIQLYPHKVRRTTATHLLKKGMPVEEIQVLLGHENISTTLIYAHVNKDSVKANHKKYMS